MSHEYFTEIVATWAAAQRRVQTAEKSTTCRCWSRLAVVPELHIGPTRLVRAAALSTPDRDIYLKLKTELPTGSFKVRGVVHSFP
jgi:threonine dehydratase